SWNLLGKGDEKIPLLASANGRGDYHDDFDYIFAVKEALARQGIESTVHKISTRDSKGRATAFSNNPVLYPNKVD
ncbi:hypothetical protein LL972_20680, partial [Xanthomonas campestris pv. asclepiadis]|uniref:hypothetical protein n=1 Tax=Xanthomonas campestris TaxID=339 RepID=UPI001E326FA5